MLFFKKRKKEQDEYEQIKKNMEQEAMSGLLDALKRSRADADIAAEDGDEQARFAAENRIKDLTKIVIDIKHNKADLNEIKIKEGKKDRAVTLICGFFGTLGNIATAWGTWRNNSMNLRNLTDYEKDHISSGYCERKIIENAIDNGSSIKRNILR